MERTLYLECNSGISGDMMVAALLDLGADREALDKALGSLPVQGFRTEIKRVKKAGLDVCDFLVKLDGEYENHDHDMGYLFGHGAAGEEGHNHSQEDEGVEVHSHGHGSIGAEAHSHGHGSIGAEAHSHGHASAGAEAHGHRHGTVGGNEPAGVNGHVHENHVHRGLPEILDIIGKAEISARAKETASRIFQILAQAEARAHGVPAEQVHFHEVGAVDSIVDIVAAAVCLDSLGVTEVIVPYVCEGRGSIRCQHGILPVPVPAVIHIAEAYGIPLRVTDREAELVTPTGAAIVAAVRTSGRLPAEFVVAKTGIGAGKRSYERPSLLRAMLIEGTGEEEADTVCKLETNIDDCTGEILGHVMKQLLERGARDVYYTPAYMKKNRPAYQLNVICDESKRKELEQIIFRETTTIGIRHMKMRRTVLQREMEGVMLQFGELKVKKCILPDGSVKRYPEYESAAELAGKNGVALQRILDEYKRTCP